MRYAFGTFFLDERTFADRIFVSEDTFAVADGMGGGKGGILAAQTAVSEIERSRPFKSISEIEDFFRTLNRKIIEEVARLGDVEVAGTTLSLISFWEGEFLLGHVGDSKVFLKRGNKVEMISEDQVLIKNGRKTVKALGIEWDLKVHTLKDKAFKGDMFLIGSDGLEKLLSKVNLKDLLVGDPQKVAESIVDTYRGMNLKEDLAVVVVEVE